MAPSQNALPAVITGVVLLLVVLVMYYNTPTESASPNLQGSVVAVQKNSHNVFFPLIVHHMWKSGSSPPVETIRWRKGCQALNPSHEFRMYNDDDLKKFTEANYPQYLPLFNILKGVYMADMARLLVTYHYGGLYLDLDFYCHRPFVCFETVLSKQLQAAKAANVSDILVVSREPTVHAELFRNKSRVIIQDFFLATPRHPFILWLLDDRMKRFNEDPLHYSVKGPFSYAIEKDIDAYKEVLKQQQQQAETAKKQAIATAPVKVVSSPALTAAPATKAPPPLIASNATAKTVAPATSTSNSGKPAGYRVPPLPTNTSNSSKPISPKRRLESAGVVKAGWILELSEDITHPLIDASNSHLGDHCGDAGSSSSSGASSGDKSKDDLADAAAADKVTFKKSCDIVKQRNFFNPSDQTILVHMWTHVYLGWSFIRGTYNSGAYSQVEKTLLPTYRCPSIDN